MSKFFLVFALAPFMSFDANLFVANWERAIKMSIAEHQSDNNLSNSIRNELQDLLMFYSSGEQLPALSEKDNARLSFVKYAIVNNAQAIENGGIIIERPMSGEKNTITYFLLTKVNKKYVIVPYRYDYGWHMGRKAVMTMSYVDSLLLQKNCYPNGYNDDNVVVSKFSRNGSSFTSQFYYRSSFCKTLNTLDNL